MARIVIVEPRPEWPQEFLALSRRLGEALGALALRVEHIGSTAVAGLAAKDVIDVQVSVPPASFETAEERMVAAGFTWWPDVSSDHTPPGATLPSTELEKRLATERAGERRANIHLRIPGRFNHRYALLFRDYLRAHPSAAAAYGEIKRTLARMFPDDLDSYYDVKDPVFDVIMAGAEDWAAGTGWSETAPGQGDAARRGG